MRALVHVRVERSYTVARHIDIDTYIDMSIYIAVYIRNDLTGKRFLSRVSDFFVRDFFLRFFVLSFCCAATQFDGTTVANRFGARVPQATSASKCVRRCMRS